MNRITHVVVVWLALLALCNMIAQGGAPSKTDPGPVAAVSSGAGSAKAVADEDRWWPVQTLPRAVVRTREHSALAHQMLVQSVAGLAAKAVNQGKGDELVWIFNDNIDMEAWYHAFLKQHSSVEVQGALDPWELVDRYTKRGVIKGYILYAPDKSEGRINDHRAGMDLSVNVATSLAGLLDGVLVDESLEKEARAHGLSKLLDVRGKTQAWCFESYKDRFNRRLLCAQDPRKSNLRDLAIAQQALVLYGAEEPTELAMKWLEPLSPIAGWNGGDEFETTRLSSIHGHLQTTTDWCMNLPVLMAESERAPARSAKAFDPRGIDWSDRRSCVSFILTDGDNVQWLQSSFFRGNTSYWANPDRGQIPFGWSCCFAQLAQLCPVALEHALATQKGNDRFIEWGAGYYFPDLFGHSRPDGNELLARQARRTWKFMQQTGTRIIAFNVANADSPEALQAYETIVRETDDLSAILIFQYSPYEAGAGRKFWVKDRRGVEVPVIPLGTRSGNTPTIVRGAARQLKSPARSARAPRAKHRATIGRMFTLGRTFAARQEPMKMRKTCRKTAPQPGAACADTIRPCGVRNDCQRTFGS